MKMSNVEMVKSTIRVLMIEDDPNDACLVREYLALAGTGLLTTNYAIQEVEDLGLALSALVEGSFDIILVDLSLPDSQGLDTVLQILAAAPDTPAIVISGQDDQDVALQVVQAGAQDYLEKGHIDQFSLPRAIRYAMGRKRADLILRESETQLSEAQRIAQLGSWEVDLATGQISWSDEMYRLYGISPETFEPTIDKFLDLIHPQDRLAMSAWIESAQSETKVDDLEFRVIWPDGSLRVLLGAGQALVNAKGIPVRVMGVAQDITERKQAEAQAHQRNEDLALLGAINAAVNRGESLENIISLISNEVKRIFGSLGATLYLIDPAGERLVMQNMALPSERLSQIEKLLGISIPPLEHDLRKVHPFRQALESKKAYLVTDAAQIQEFILANIPALPFTQKTTRRLEKLIPALIKLLGLKSQLIVPLISSGEVIGTLDIGSRGLFTEQDLKRIESITGQLTAAIQRKQAEQAVLQSETRFRGIFEGVRDAIFVETLSGQILDVNPRACEMYGYSREQFLTKTVFDLVPSSPLALFVEGGSGNASGPATESINIRANGEQFPVEVSGQVQMIADEQVVLVVVRDISRRKHDEETLNLQSAALKSAANGIVITDRAGVIEWVNPAYTRLTGYPAEEAIGQNPRLLKSGKNSQAVYENLWQTILSGQVWRGELVNKRKDGSFYTEEQTITPVKDAHGQISHFIAIKHDISERKRAAEALAQHTAELAGLHEVSQAIRAIRDVREVYGQLSEKLAMLIGAEMCAVALLDRDHDQIQAQTPGYGISDDVLAQVHFPRQLLDRFAWGPEGRDFFLANAPDAIPAKFQRVVQPLGIRSVLMVPLQTADPSSGFVFALNKPNGFDEEDVHMMKTLANQAGVLIEKAELFDKTQRQLKVSRLLHAVAMLAVEAANEDELIERTTALIGDALYPDNFGVLLVDDARQVLTVTPAYRGVGEENKQLTLPIGQGGVAAHVAATGKTYRITDSSQDALYFAVNPGMNSELCVPLLIGQRVIGVINAESATLNAFSEDDERLLDTLAAQLATTIARLRKEVEERQQRILAQALSNTVAALNRSLDFNTVLNEILDNVIKIIPCDAVSVMLIEGQQVRIASQLGYSNLGVPDRRKDLRLELAEWPNFEKIMATRQPVLVNDTASSSDWIRFENDQQDWIHAYLGVPIRDEHKVIGFLNLDHSQAGFFTQAHIQAMQVFAEQMSTALKNARLYQQAVLAAERRAVLHQVSQRVVSASGDLESVYDAIYQAVSQLMPVDAFALSLQASSSQDVALVCGYDYSERMPHTRIPYGSGLSGRVLVSGQSLRIADLQKETDFEPVPFSQNQHVRAILAVPIRLGNKTLGMLSAQSDQPDDYDEEDQHLLEMLAAHAAAAIENAKLFAATQRQVGELALLFDISSSLTLALFDPHQTEITIARQLVETLNFPEVSISLYTPETDMLECIIDYISEEAFDTIEKNWTGKTVPLSDFPATARVIETHQPLVVHASNPEADPAELAHLQEVDSATVIILPLVIKGQAIGVLELEDWGNERHFSEDDLNLSMAVANQVAVALENARLLDETQRRLKELEVVNRVSIALRAAETLDEMLPIFLGETLAVMNTPAGGLALYNPKRDAFEKYLSRGWFDYLSENPPQPQKGISSHVMREGRAYVSPEFASDPMTRREALPFIPAGWGGACLPIHAGLEIIGLVYVSVELPRQIRNQEISLLTTLTELIGSAIQRTRLHEQTIQQIDRLASLRTIDNAINASLDLKFSLNVLLDQTLDQLDMDAATVLLFNPHELVLEYAVGKGFRSKAQKQLRLRLGESQAGKAALQRKIIAIPNLSDRGVSPEKLEFLAGEDFQAYFAAPLISKGELKGVLETFKRSAIDPGQEWLDFFMTLAGQAAIAIDNANLFQSLQGSNQELRMAYDRTIEGWARALELRDNETEGHSRRVTEMTLDLARAAGISDEQLVNIRRGALLHDMGKMGIPDSILLKPCALTEDEWVLMRKHPVFAYEMLKSIDYLYPALEIPHYHHEKWDGTGYPHGQQGEQIPLAARIFAIADVWDALSSDRPYRKAWPTAQVINYIKEQRGKHFDPRVVAIFLEYIESQPAR